MPTWCAAEQCAWGMTSCSTVPTTHKGIGNSTSPRAYDKEGTDATTETGSDILSVADDGAAVATGEARLPGAHQQPEGRTPRCDWRCGRRSRLKELRPSGWSDGHVPGGR